MSAENKGRSSDNPRLSSAYRVLLFLLPKDFRQHYGDEMVADFELRLRDTDSVHIRVCWLALIDIIQSLPSEWSRHWRRSTDPANPRPSSPPVRLIRALRSSVESFVQDLRWAWRSLKRGPAWSLAAVATIAIGLAATTAVFSLIHGLLLKPLPYDRADRLVEVWPQKNFNKSLVQRIDDAVPAIEDISGISNWTLTLTGLGMPEELLCSLVSVHHFDLLGVQPAIGRSFRAEESRPGNDHVVILSHQLWMRRFGGDPGILGQSIPLSGAEVDHRTVIGVMPPGHRPITTEAEAPQLWAPLADPESWEVTADSSWFVNTRIGRLAAGASLAEARAQLRTETLRLYQEGLNNIDEESARTADLIPLTTTRRGDLTRPLLLLFAAVAFVLLMGCANVANLMLARGETRTREISMRQALGASRYRIVRQLLLESLLLALGGAAIGGLLATVAVRLLARFAKSEVPRAQEVGLEPTVLLFAVCSGLGAGLLFGFLPALRASRTNRLGSLRSGTGGTGGLGSSSSLSRWLVSTEIALATIVLVAAGLMVRSLDQLYRVDPGFSARNVLSVRVNPPSSKYPEGSDFTAVYDRVLARLRTTPGVESVGAIQLLPLTTGDWAFPSYPEGLVIEAGEIPPSISFRVVRPGYFSTLEIPLRAGRLLTESDVRDEHQTRILVNETLAREFWPDNTALDREIRLFGPDGQSVRIVGVVGDVRQFQLDRNPRPEIYVSAREWSWPVSLTLLVRSHGDPQMIAGPVRRAIRSVDPDLVIADVEALDRVVARSAGHRRFVAVLLTSFSLIALLLGAVGVFGVSSYLTLRQLPEVGLRKALGASRSRLLVHGLSDGLRPIVWGLALGLVGASATSSLLGSLLYDVSANDPLTVGTALLFLLLVSTAATAIPTWRASRVDPMKVLRED